MREPEPRTDAAATSALIKVLIVDDHIAFGEAVSIAIDLQHGLSCVGRASTLREAMELVATTRPDVILMDVQLPDGDGIDAIRRVADAAPEAVILILTGHTDAAVVARAAAAGASGFLPKESPIDVVLKSIRGARGGGMLVEAVLASLLSGTAPAAASKPVPLPDEMQLTQREHDVLELMAQGQSSHSIAVALGISLHTCRGYQKSVMAKLDAHTQLEAVVIATRRHLVALAG